MSRRKRESIQHQVKTALDDKLRIGTSKYADKLAGTAAGGIYSWSTYKSYLKHGTYFARWARSERGCRTLEEARPYVDEWIQSRVAQGLSAWSIKLEVAALNKVYGGDLCITKTPSRHRADITRSRGSAVRDKGFSASRNAEFVEFCKATGLRRSEVACLTGDKLIRNKDGSFSIKVEVGTKGGRSRTAPIIGPHTAQIASRMLQAGSGKVWPSLPSHADIHGYRASYAASLYRMCARPLETAKTDGGVYWCRRDRAGTGYDKRALKAVSEALGHSRIDVVPGHYLN